MSNFRNETLSDFKGAFTSTVPLASLHILEGGVSKPVRRWAGLGGKEIDPKEQ